MRQDVQRDDLPRTMSVPVAGARYLGLSRGAAYRAAAAGVIPVIKIGRRLKVPTSAMEKLLDSAGDRGSK